ncbi:MMPL family transporter [Citricoccus sp. GCM10030269]|uniref:MMPL family transporter n=1 Tax=Citricoccus sp. GCM10030269 TaxID=3273388 RepID=UPI003611244F
MSPAPSPTQSSTSPSAPPRHRAGSRRGPRLWSGVAVRVAAAAVVVLAWLAGTGLGGPTFGRLGEVTSNDQATFLPASAESTRAGEWASRFTDGDQIPALIVAELPGGQILAEGSGEMAALSAWGEKLGAVDGVDQMVGPVPSEDREAIQYIALINAESAEPDVVVEDLRRVLEAAKTDPVAAGAEDLAGVNVHVTGPAGLSADLAGAFAGIDGVLLAVALGAVFLILVLVYRSVLLPILVLLNSVAALCVAVLTIYGMASEQWIALNGQSQGILSILVIGAATDYSLLMVARYREELRREPRVWLAVRSAWRGSFEPITASAATVALALLCLLISDLNSNRSLGPIAASGIVLAWAASLTFLPAVLYLCGRSAFWPAIPRPAVVNRPKGSVADQAPDVAMEPLGDRVHHGVWSRIGAMVARRPRTVWIVTSIVLLVGAGGVTQLQASGVAQSDVLLGESDAKAGQVVLSEHFDAGTGAPVTVIAPAERGDQVLQTVQAYEGVASASLTADGGAPAGAPAGSPAGAPGDQQGDQEGAQQGEATAPLEVDGRVYLQATLTHPADSAEAESTVVDLRRSLHDLDPDILVGGTTATALDSNTTAQADLKLIIPLVLLVVLLILMALLRSILAPVLLVLATVLSFGTAIGVSALVFNHVFGFPGADPSVPLYGFVFLVALGVDYTIFLMTRAREEAAQIGTRAGVLKALTVTGGVITSAGVVLAATFAALAVIPLMFMVQLAFIVAFGVLLDTFLVRSLVVPAVTLDIGPAVWWPSKLSRASGRRKVAG